MCIRDQANVINDNQICSQDPGDGFGYGVVSAMSAQQDAEVLEGEPGNAQSLLDGVLSEGLQQEGLAGPTARTPRGSPGGGPIPGCAAPAGSGPGSRTPRVTMSRRFCRWGNPRWRGGWPGRSVPARRPPP